MWLADMEKQAIEQRVLAEGAWRLVGIRSGSAQVEAVRFPGLSVVPAEIFGS